jgi:uncharacterized protein YndB with AHSA1/START domain
MGREFEIVGESEVAATPEQVWEAISTGPGIDSWFMGRNEVLPIGGSVTEQSEMGKGSTVRTEFGGYAPESTVTAWDPLRRLAYGTAPAGDGRFVAYEFLIEGREQGSTVLRMVTSGFLPGDDWADEYEAMTKGLALFFRTLVEYVTYFAGRTATPVTAFGPRVDDWPAAWRMLGGALGLAGSAAEGDRVQFADPRGQLISGVVYFVNPDAVGVRADQGIYRFLRALQGSVLAGHHIFDDAGDSVRTERAWAAWLERVFG